MKFVLNDFCKIKDINLKEVGGKAYNLMLLKAYKINVPKFFVVTARAFYNFLNFNNIDILAENKKKIKSLIKEGVYPEELKKEIFEALNIYQFNNMAIRSSACVEDSKDYSFAGQFETYLAVKQNSILTYIKQCWESMFDSKIITYMPNLNNFSMAVIVQEMIASEYSGVTFTVNPINRNNNEMIVEVIEGVGKLLVDGEAIPTMYIINKKNLSVNKHINGRQEEKLYVDLNNELTISKNNMPSLPVDQNILILLAKLCFKIETLINCPVDIEWTLSQDILYVLQARPITTINQFIKL